MVTDSIPRCPIEVPNAFLSKSICLAGFIEVDKRSHRREVGAHADRTESTEFRDARNFERLQFTDMPRQAGPERIKTVEGTVIACKRGGNNSPYTRWVSGLRETTGH